MHGRRPHPLLLTVRPTKKRAGSRTPTKFLTVSAMLAALGVILLGLGSLISTLDLTCAALASMLCIWAVIEMGGAYPWMIWGVTALLSLLLLPQKTPGVLYLCIGAYPMIKARLEHLPRPAEWALKLVTLHVMIALCYGALRLFVPEEAAAAVGWMLAVTYLLALAAFLLYDYALTKLITFYLLRLQPRLGLRKKRK